MQVDIIDRPKSKAIKTRLYFYGTMLLVLAAGLLIYLAPVFSTCERLKTLTVIHLSDSHLCDLSGAHPAVVKKREYLGKNASRLARFFSEVPSRVGADFVVITGDLIDYFEAQGPQQQWIRGQIEVFIRRVAACPVPLLLCLGNHDIASYIYREGRVSCEQYNATEAREAWRRKIRCFRQGTYYSHLYQVGSTRYRLIFLDNGYLLTFGKARGTRIGRTMDAVQLTWLENQLKAVRDEVVVLFMHIPLPVGDTNQDGVHFPSPIEGWPLKDTYEQGLFRLLNTYSCVKALFVGHHHRNLLEDIVLPAGHRVAQIETASIGERSTHWRLVQFCEHAILISAAGETAVEKRIALD